MVWGGGGGWGGSGGSEDSWHLKVPMGSGFEKYRMMDVGVGGENFANTAQ